MGSIHGIFDPCGLEIWWMTLKNKRTPFLYYIKLCAHLKMLNSGQKWRFVVPCDLEIWRMTLENDKTPLLYYIKLCTSFQSHQLIQTGVRVRKHPIRVKIVDFLFHVTLKFDGWPWKTIRHLLFATSSFASFPSHQPIKTGGMVRKRLNYVLTSATLTFDLDLLHGHPFCHW